MQASRLAFAARTEQFKNFKFELELIKVVECFLDAHGNYASNLVSFKKSLCKLTIF